jgi:DNA invertase Pin-like site-specific DNA recombinase
MSKQLRIAALVRVSTERQENRGESLRTQPKQIGEAAAALGGKVVARYGGQEHATPEFEHAEVDRLLADASRGRFDAVMVTHPDRWSRDNGQSKKGLEVLRSAGVGFYVLTLPYDLYDPTARFYLGVSAEIGEYNAMLQAKKSLENRIERARRGVPTAGKVPFGRTWDKKAQRWVVDVDKQARMVEVADRYLKGERLPDLAREFGMNHSNLCKTLRGHCGDRWRITLASKRLNIKEEVTLEVPRLLPDQTIRAVLRRMQDNSTRLHGRPSHDYLLNGYIFCAQCGYNMTGQPCGKDLVYYRHPHRRRVRDCPCFPQRPRIRADKIEQAVLKDLFTLFGNPAAIERACRAAVPDCDKARKQKARLEAELDKVAKARARLIDAIADGLLTKQEAQKKMDDLRQQEAGLAAELDRLDAALDAVPDLGALRVHAERIPVEGGTSPLTGEPLSEIIVVYDEHGSDGGLDGPVYLGGNDFLTWANMSGRDKRELVAAVFSGPLADGKPSGVYVTQTGGHRTGPKTFTYELRGHLSWKIPQCTLS